jgi:hypothetical protein
LAGRLSLDNTEEFPKGLGGAFAQFFARQFPDIDNYRTEFRPILETIVAAFEPLPLKILASALKKDPEEIKKLCDSMGSLFPITNECIRPFHVSLGDWLAYSDRAGQYFISMGNGHKRLAKYGMREYRTGVGSMSPYMLAHLPEHLVKAERWDDLKVIVSDPAYISLLEDTNARRISNLADISRLM